MTDKPTAPVPGSWSALQWRGPEEKPDKAGDIICNCGLNSFSFLRHNTPNSSLPYGTVAWSHLPTAQDAVTVEEADCCYRCPCFDDQDECQHKYGPAYLFNWKAEGGDITKQVHPFCPLRERAHLIMLSPDARKRLEQDDIGEAVIASEEGDK